MGKQSRRARPAAAAAPPPTPLSEPRLAAGIAAALVVAVIIVYAGVLHHEFVSFDDAAYVTENPHVNSGLSGANVAWAFTQFYASNWHPLTWLSHMLDVQLFGLDAGKHALVSVLLHALNGALLFFVLRRATQRLWPSAAVAALFALHPLHVESVAWIAERKDVLSTLFFLAAIWFYIGWARHRSSRDYVLVIVCFALGLMAKPMVITLPFVLLLLDYWPLGRDVRTTIVEKVPLFILMLPSAILTMRAQTEAMAPVPLLARISNALISYVVYLWKAFWPAHLAAFYPYRVTIKPSVVALAFFILAGITVAVILRIRREPFRAVGWFWYLGTLVPVSGITQVGQQSMADRYTYIPLIGIFIVVVWSIAEMRVTRQALAFAAGVVLVVLAALTVVQVRTWQDSVTLFAHAAEVTDNNHVANTNLGSALVKKADYAGAATAFRTAIAINEQDPLAHNGLGVALSAQGDNEGAAREFRRAIELDPKKSEPYRNLGRLALAGGNNAEAVMMLEKADEIQPDPASAAATAVARGDFDGAIKLYQQSIARNPKDADLHNDLASILSKRGRDAEALEEYKKAIDLAPHQYDARMNLGALLTRFNRQAEAIEQLQAAAKEKPKSTEPHVYLALTFAQMGRIDDAIGEIQQAITIDPNAADADVARATHQNTGAQQLLAYLQSKR